MSKFEKVKEALPGKEKFYSLLTDRKISHKECENVLNVSHRFEIAGDRLSRLAFKI